MKTTYWYWIWKTFLGPSRLRKKFVRTFLLAGLIPLVLMGLVSVYLINATHRIDVEALEKNLARQVAVEVNKNIDETSTILNLILSFEEFAPLKFNQQDFFLEGILKENDSLSEVAFICLTPLQCAPGKETKRWVRVGSAITPSQELRSRDNDPGFLAAEQGKKYLGPVVFNDAGPHIALAASVYNKKRQIIAVLSGEMDLKAIQKILKDKEIRLGETGYAYIVDASGKIISHPNQGLLGKDVSALPVIKALDQNKSGYSPSVVYENIEGEQVSAVGALITGLGWRAIAEWPRKETQGLIFTVFIQIGLFFLAALCIITAISSWMAFSLIQPIAQISEGTSIIGNGNFGYRVRIKTGDELENLGANLNKMAENLKGLEELHELKLRTDLLSESLRKEQELSKLKDQFITTVSHQLNTPLSVISWALEAMADPTITPEKVKENLAVVSKSEQDVAAIVNDLVTLSEVGFRYQKVKAQPSDIAALTMKAVERLSSAAKIKDVNVNCRKLSENTTANVNEFTLAKALENLIDNAIAYSQDGGEVDIEVSERNNDILFKIQDRGIGIPKADQPLIFQQFFRARNSVSKKNVGTGLGLFITKNIIDGHGGSISFESEENNGSTFYFSIPKG